MGCPDCGGGDRRRFLKTALLGTASAAVAAALPRKVTESETLVKELGNIRIKVSLAGHDTYGAWREGEHDDLVLAAALACWRAFKKAPPPMWGRNPIV